MAKTILMKYFVNTWYNVFFVLHYPFFSVDVTLSVSLELFSLDRIALSTTPGMMQVVCGSWFRWLVSRIRSCADKLGGGWEWDEVQRTAKLYEDDGHGNDVGLRRLLPAAVIMAARALLPQTSRRWMTNKRGARRNYSQPWVVSRYCYGIPSPLLHRYDLQQVSLRRTWQALSPACLRILSPLRSEGNRWASKQLINETI